jgi:hypothetical protein
MSLQFNCPSCNTLSSIANDKAGSVVSCGHCHANVLVRQSVPSVVVPVVERIEYQRANQSPVEGFTIIEDEPQSIPLPPAAEGTTEQTAPPKVHRPWFRDPIIVFGWLLPLYILAGFILWMGMDLKTKWVLTSPRKAVSSERLVQAPVDLEAKTQEKTQPHETEKPSPPEAVLPEKPVPPVAAALADDNDEGADIKEVDEPADENAFDLRGPVPPVDFKVRERITLNGVRASEFLKPNAKPITIRADITKEVENIYTVTAVANDQVIEYSTEFVAGHTTTIFVGLDLRRRTTEKLDDLIEQTITSKKIGRNWAHGILDHAPDEKEQIALIQLAPWFADRDSFPRERQQVGSSWAIDKAHIRKLIGGDIGAVSGNVEATFVRLQRTDEEVFAVIEYKGNIRGRFDFSDPPDIIGSIDVDLTSLRSLSTGVDATTSGSLTIRSHHKTDIDGLVDVSAVSSLKIQSIAKVENQEPKRKKAGLPRAEAAAPEPNGP